jgi:glycosyltransferase involved in cell wall biosynthesis
MHEKRHERPVIVCLAHLGWDFVWQRPQQILSRLAQQHHYPIYYINEPFLDPTPRPTLKLVDRRPNLAAYQPLFPEHDDYVRDNWANVYVDLVRQLLTEEGVLCRNGEPAARRPLLLWFYTPMSAYFAERLTADLIVYDIMDELANFKGAPADIKQRAMTLLAQADIAFAGGLSLYEAHRGLHDNLHLFRSGVDVEHFRLHDDTPVAPEISRLPGPVLGYYGVIDERLDLELIDRLATDHPEWSVVLVGPVVKIDPATLPRRPNLHYPGMQPYERLPHFLKGFDVCLMPFAINDATRYISPTKTLEYMAAGKPVVSTPVPDVVTVWSDVVAIAETADDFGRAVEAALRETPTMAATRHAREEAHLEQSRWDTIAEQMHRQIEAAWSRCGE